MLSIVILGLNIILVSRTPYKLQNVAAEIVEKYSKVETKIIEVDFAKEDPSSYIPKIEEAIKVQWSIPTFKKMHTQYAERTLNAIENVFNRTFTG